MNYIVLKSLQINGSALVLGNSFFSFFINIFLFLAITAYLLAYVHVFKQIAVMAINFSTKEY